MYLNPDLGGARRIASKPFALAGEATKKRPVFGRLLSPSATYFQGSGMAAVGEWRDEVGCSKLTSVSLKHAVR